MKKKFLATVLSLVLAVSMLAGCGNAKDDYKNDLEVFDDIADIDVTAFTSVADVDDMKDAVKDLKKDVQALGFTTKEGKEVKEVFLTFVESIEEFTDKASKLDAETDYEKLAELLEDLYSDMASFEEDLTDAVDKFADAAEEAGIDEDDLDELGY